MQATLALNGTWLTEPASKASIKAAPVDRRGLALLAGGGNRVFAGGRVRPILTAQRVYSTTITLQSLTDDDLALIDAWTGLTLLLRDSAGYRLWVNYYNPSWVDVIGDDGHLIHDVTLPLSTVTYTEGVG